MKQFRRYPKLTLVCHHHSHLILAAQPGEGPGNDAPDFLPAVRQACRHVAIDRLYADPAYDAEKHHRVCREELAVRSTIIPVNPRGRPWALPTGRYRQQMHRRFPKRLYGRRWHVESVISQHKRRLGSALTARTGESRDRESLLRVVTHDLMILRRAS